MSSATPLLDTYLEGVPGWSMWQWAKNADGTGHTWTDGLWYCYISDDEATRERDGLACFWARDEQSRFLQISRRYSTDHENEAIGFARGLDRNSSRKFPAMPLAGAGESPETMLQKLRRCTFPPATAPKAFVKRLSARFDQAGGLELSERELAFLTSLRHQYRRQIT